ncbi:hypothetical protein [Pradoshia sp. D12]|uniref:hypothetical protein n=1 Tax=Pradoshia sp. D12 TaxID=2651284 RepID=UPI00178C2D0B|nr:hypothetical protein [Pradoshia sp. D12]
MGINEPGNLGMAGMRSVLAGKIRGSAELILKLAGIIAALAQLILISAQFTEISHPFTFL